MLNWLHIISLFLLWRISVIVYRLWLSPLSSIPGPKLAAATLLYEFYYDAICLGKYTRKIESMHKKYGPIVRISPYEVHIKDPDFSIKAFSVLEKLDKLGWWYRVFGGPGSTVSTESHALHKSRRDAFQKSFSKRAVKEFVPTIVDKLKHVESVLRRSTDRNEAVNLSSVYRCMAADVVSHYVFPKPLDLLQTEDLGGDFHTGLRFFFEAATVSRYTSWVESVLPLLPQKALDLFLSRPAKSLISLVKPGSRTCVLQQIYNSSLDATEKTPKRLLQEAEQFIVAGSETTGNTLAVTTFHILQNSHVEYRLRQELKAAQVSFDSDFDVHTLQNLPYLSAIITEGLRVSHGVGSRLPRVNTLKSYTYDKWHIPANTPISMTSRLHHEDERLFPSPHEFQPERWLQPESKSLKKYLSPFGHGTRICVGMHLALAEVYMTIAFIFLHFEFVGVNATLDDMQSANDLGAPFPRRDSKGLEVVLRAIK
ncbi:cytochrome P450 [Xylogone sp. PMI_703]|nr:cytochrome P450 [Xylogone sp. PMI_703]